MRPGWLGIEHRAQAEGTDRGMCVSGKNPASMNLQRPQTDCGVPFPLTLRGRVGDRVQKFKAESGPSVKSRLSVIAKEPDCRAGGGEYM